MSFSLPHAEVIVGVNKYRLKKEDPIDVLVIDNTSVREGQVARLKQIRATRDNQKVQSILGEITKAAETGNGNLVQLSIEAARSRATVGEISDALEKVYGRHALTTRMVSGAYRAEYGKADEIEETLKVVDVGCGIRSSKWASSDRFTFSLVSSG
jgi:methylmalonyl-CoA mutase